MEIERILFHALDQDVGLPRAAKHLFLRTVHEHSDQQGPRDTRYKPTSPSTYPVRFDALLGSAGLQRRVRLGAGAVSQLIAVVGHRSPSEKNTEPKVLMSHEVNASETDVRRDATDQAGLQAPMGRS